MESKIGNSTHIFTETNLVLQLIEESRIKSKTVMSWSFRKKKRGHFLYSLFCRKEIFSDLCFISMCIVLNKLSEYTYILKNKHILHTKNILHTLFCLLLKLSKAFSVSLSIHEHGL